MLCVFGRLAHGMRRVQFFVKCDHSAVKQLKKLSEDWNLSWLAVTLISIYDLPVHRSVLSLAYCIKLWQLLSLIQPVITLYFIYRIVSSFESDVMEIKMNSFAEWPYVLREFNRLLAFHEYDHKYSNKSLNWVLTIIAII